MAELFSQYASGLQFTAGTIAGSAAGVSGLNPIVDRLNSISTDDNLVTGSVISGTSTVLQVSGIESPLATDIKQGVASFNDDDFTVTNGSVALANKTSYWNVPGTAFNATDMSNVTFQNKSITNTSTAINTHCQVTLPHNSVITEVIPYGSDSTAFWALYQGDNGANVTSTIASSTVNSAVSGLSHTVDNDVGNYSMTVQLKASMVFYGARIVYTTDYD